MHATGDAKLAESACATMDSRSEPWLWPTETGTSSSLQTTCLRLQRRGQPALNGLVCPATRGTCVPSDGELTATQHHPVVQHSPLVCRLGGEHTPMWCQLPTEHHCGERETVHDDFEPPAVHNVWLTQIQIAHEDVRRHTATSFAAYSRPHSKAHPTLAQHPGLCARCTVMAKLIEWEATPAGTHVQVKRETQTAQTSDTEQLRRNGRDAARGAGHQNHACSWSSLGPDRSLGAGAQPGSKHLVSDSLVRNHPCHVWVVWLSGVLSMMEVRNHGPPPIAWRLPLQLPTQSLWVTLQLCHHLHRDVRVASMYHRETVCPTAPVSGKPVSHSTAQHQPSHGQRQRCGRLHACFTLVQVHVQNPCQALPNLVVMVVSELFRAHNPQNEIGTCSRTMQPNEPGTLQIMDHWKSAEQQVVFGGHLLQELPDRFSSAEKIQSLLVARHLADGSMALALLSS